MARVVGSNEIESCQDWLVLEHHPERTLLLVGRTGTGKSATGNSILGVHKFESKTRGKYITKECDLQKSTLPNGLKVNVIDTPDLISASSTTEITSRDIGRCAKNGIDAVLLVFSVKNRLTEEEHSTLGKLKIVFGNQIVEYVIVVFTNEDALVDGETLNDYLQDCPEFQEILKECDDRKVLFDNRRDAPARKKDKQVQDLLYLVEQISKKNKGKSYLSLELRDNRFIIDDKPKQIEAMKSLSSKQETSELKVLEKSYKKMLKGTEDKVSNQLKDSLRELKEEISKAEAKREEAEEKMNQNQKQTADEINKKLNKELKKLKEEIKKIKEKLQM